MGDNAAANELANQMTVALTDIQKEAPPAGAGTFAIDEAQMPVETPFRHASRTKAYSHDLATAVQFKTPTENTG